MVGGQDVADHLKHGGMVMERLSCVGWGRGTGSSGPANARDSHVRGYQEAESRKSVSVRR